MNRPCPFCTVATARIVGETNLAVPITDGFPVSPGHTLIEGVRALIVEKDNAPKWNPETLEGVTEAMLDDIFAPLPSDQTWSPLTGL